jgi:hypothetical protein
MVNMVERQNKPESFNFTNRSFSFGDVNAESWSDNANGAFTQDVFGQSLADLNIWESESPQGNHGKTSVFKSPGSSWTHKNGEAFFSIISKKKETKVSSTTKVKKKEKKSKKEKSTSSSSKSSSSKSSTKSSNKDRTPAPPSRPPSISALQSEQFAPKLVTTSMMQEIQHGVEQASPNKKKFNFRIVPVDPLSASEHQQPDQVSLLMKQLKKERSSISAAVPSIPISKKKTALSGLAATAALIAQSDFVPGSPPRIPSKSTSRKVPVRPSLRAGSNSGISSSDDGHKQRVSRERRSSVRESLNKFLDDASDHELVDNPENQSVFSAPATTTKRGSSNKASVRSSRRAGSNSGISGSDDGHKQRVSRERRSSVKESLNKFLDDATDLELTDNAENQSVYSAPATTTKRGSSNKASVRSSRRVGSNSNSGSSVGGHRTPSTAQHDSSASGERKQGERKQQRRTSLGGGLGGGLERHLHSTRKNHRGEKECRSVVSDPAAQETAAALASRCKKLSLAF